MALKLIVIVFWLRLDCNKNKKENSLKKIWKQKYNVFCILNDCGNVKLWHMPKFIHVFGIKRLRALNLSGFVCLSSHCIFSLLELTVSSILILLWKTTKYTFHIFALKKKVTFIDFKEKK